MDLAETCLNCRYWRERDDSEYGCCRRHAPRPYVEKTDINVDYNDDLLDVTHWPETHFTDWCGEMIFNSRPETIPF